MFFNKVSLKHTHKFSQGLLENFDDIFVASGSAGTVCGLAVAKYLTKAKIKSVTYTFLQLLQLSHPLCLFLCTVCIQDPCSCHSQHRRVYLQPC